MAGEAAQHEFKNHMVSTHSHPKGAGDGLIAAGLIEEQHGFNTQPPEGGWFQIKRISGAVEMFQHTATRRWLAVKTSSLLI